jgi:hypothetical protein
MRRQHGKVGYRVTAQHTVMGIGHRRAAARELDLQGETDQMPLSLPRLVAKSKEKAAKGRVLKVR